MSEVEIIERYLILLLGAMDRAIPSSLHLQKEMFLLFKANTKIVNYLDFKKHYMGPYSIDLDDISQSPAIHSDAYEFNRKGNLNLTEKGEQIFEGLLEEYSGNEKFKELLSMMKLVRTLYDNLSKDELLFLIYTTYPEYKLRSSESKRILAPHNKRRLAASLLEKGLISEKRYDELIKNGE